jgi:predicted nucleic acid-binding protein
VRLVLDAGAAIEVVLGRGKALEFERLLGDADQVLAPDLIVSEVVNTIWKYHQFQNLSLTLATRRSSLLLVSRMSWSRAESSIARLFYWLALRGNLLTTCSIWHSRGARMPDF